MIAASDVASAERCESPTTSDSVGTNRMPPPTPNIPERIPAAKPKLTA